MANLRVDKIAAPIVKDEFTGSVQFDGTGDYLSVPDNGDFDASGDFTIEFWANLSLTDSDAWLVTKYNSASNQREYIVTVNSSGKAAFYWSTDGSTHGALNTSNGVITAYKWNHYAWVKEGSVLTGYINGVALVQKTDLTSQYNNSSNPLYVGSLDGSQSFKGYISNLRICKGHAVYTGNFTVPTRELPVHTAPPKGVVFPAADNRTVLLACQSSTDATAEATGRHILTANGNATAADANPGLFRKTNITSTITENTGSVFFDGTDDRLDIASSTDFRIADSNTFECWINYNSLPGNNLFLGVESSYWVGYNHTGVGGASNKFVFTIYNGSSWQAVSSSTTPVVGTWYHLAAIKDGTSLKMFINGALENTTTMSGTAAVVNDFFNIGKWNQASAGQGVNGYLSNVRVCKGHAVYTSKFAPPTTELEVHPETVLLCCYDGENIFADKTGRHIIAAYGDRLSSPTPTATDSPIGSTTVTPGLTREVDPTAGPTFQGGAGFVSQNWLTLPKGTTTDRNRTGGRGISGGVSKAMEYIQISSMGNALDFGDMTYSVGGYTASCSSSTRGLISGGFVAPNTGNNTIDAVTIATTGNAQEFGDIPQTAVYGMGGCSSSTRGLFAGGYKASSPAADAALLQINYVTIATFGNAQDFGDLTEGVRYSAGASSPTRGIFAGGRDSDSSPNNHNIISYVTIATLGNAQDFGDLLRVGYSAAGNNSSTRAIIAGGYAPGATNQIDYVTISSTGNAQDFGDLIGSSRGGSAGMSNSIRGVFAGGANPSNVNAIEYVNIASTGDGQQFGDLITASSFVSGISDSHGGLS
jgi:hypothetical protein